MHARTGLLVFGTSVLLVAGLVVHDPLIRVIALVGTIPLIGATLLRTRRVMAEQKAKLLAASSQATTTIERLESLEARRATVGPKVLKIRRISAGLHGFILLSTGALALRVTPSMNYLWGLTAAFAFLFGRDLVGVVRNLRTRRRLDEEIDEVLGISEDPLGGLEADSRPFHH